MNLAGIILFMIWVSICVVVIVGWAFKTIERHNDDRNNDKDDLVNGPNATAWQARSYDEYVDSPKVNEDKGK